MDNDTAQVNLTLCSAIGRDLCLVTRREGEEWVTRVECVCGCGRSYVAVCHETELQAHEEHRIALHMAQGAPCNAPRIVLRA